MPAAIDRKAELGLLQKQNRVLADLLKIGRELTTERRVEDVIATLGRSIGQLVPTAQWGLQLWNEDNSAFLPAASMPAGSWGFTDPSAGACLQLCQWLADQNLPLLVCEPGNRRSSCEIPGCEELSAFEIMAGIPIVGTDRPLGVLLIGCSRELAAQVEMSLQALESLAEFLAIAIENARHCEKLSLLNITDDLTGLYNARYFHHLIEYELERARRYGHDLSLIFIDLDFFKRVNDFFGHLAGSALLSEVGEMFKENMRRVNLACRYGGDEFAVLLPSTPKNGAVVLAEALRQALHEAVFSAGGHHQVKITASFGIASYPGDARSKEELIKLADAAMYRVKHHGRDGIAAHRSEWESLLDWP